MISAISGTGGSFAIMAATLAIQVESSAQIGRASDAALQRDAVGSLNGSHILKGVLVDLLA